jgi:hypothetical protein
MLRKGEALAPPLLICTIALFRAASFSSFLPMISIIYYSNISHYLNLDILGHSNIGLTGNSVPEGLGAVCA